MKSALSILALALAGCVGAPVSQTTLTACANLPAARAAEDIALSMAKNPPSPEALAAIKASRAQMDLRCAEAASAPK